MRAGVRIEPGAEACRAWAAGAAEGEADGAGSATAAPPAKPWARSPLRADCTAISTAGEPAEARATSPLEGIRAEVNISENTKEQRTACDGILMSRLLVRSA